MEKDEFKMGLILLFGPMLAGLVFWIWFYRYQKQRVAKVLPHMSGGWIVALALITLPFLFFGGCVAMFANYPPDFR